MSRTIAVFAQREDIHAERLCAEIDSLGAKAFRVDAEEVENVTTTFVDGTFSYCQNDQEITFEDIEATFVRRRPNSRDFGITEKSNTATVDEYISLQKEMLFQDSLFALERSCRFYNTFSSTLQYLGKLNQDEIARQVGLTVAPSIVGSDNQKTIAFIENCWSRGTRVCTKPLAQKNIDQGGTLLTRYTEILEKGTNIADEDFEACPLIFQEYIEKDYELRVTVIDSKVMAVRIDSQAAPGETKTDWRKYNVPKTPHSIYKLSDEMSEKLIQFHKLTGLRFSAFDLIKSTAGHYVFLETNPSGQWLWLENLTGYPITKEIASVLCKAQPRR